MRAIRRELTRSAALLGCAESVAGILISTRSLGKHAKHLLLCLCQRLAGGTRFGDSTLTEKFTWKKKNEYLQAAGRGPRRSQPQRAAVHVAQTEVSLEVVEQGSSS